MPTRTPKPPKVPDSPARLAANRANAAQSTGPRTAEGKARSAQNARKHGFTAANFAVIRLEGVEGVENLRQDLIDFYQPANSQELFAVERIALAQQSLLRIAAMETGLLTDCLHRTVSPITGETRFAIAPDLANGIEIAGAQNRAWAMAVGFDGTTSRSPVWNLFLRYQAQTERLYRRAIEDFERLRASGGRVSRPAGDLQVALSPTAPSQPATPEPTPSASSSPLSPNEPNPPTQPQQSTALPSTENEPAAPPPLPAARNRTPPDPPRRQPFSSSPTPRDAAEPARGAGKPGVM